jgi:hypothetical protein
MQRKNEIEKLDYFVNVRTTRGEKELLKEDAELAGLGVSELIRRRYLGKKIVPSADLAVLRELRRQGGLLKHIHLQSNGMYSAETAQALQSMTRAFERVANDR